MYILYTYPDFWLKGNKRERPSFERPYTFSKSLGKAKNTIVVQRDHERQRTSKRKER